MRNILKIIIGVILIILIYFTFNKITVETNNEKKIYGFILGDHIQITPEMKKIQENGKTKFCKSDFENVFGSICAIVSNNNIVEEIILEKKNDFGGKLFEIIYSELNPKYNIRCNPFYSWGVLAGYNCTGLSESNIKVDIYIHDDFLQKGHSLINQMEDKLQVSFKEHKNIIK